MERNILLQIEEDGYLVEKPLEIALPVTFKVDSKKYKLDINVRDEGIGSLFVLEEII